MPFEIPKKINNTTHDIGMYLLNGSIKQVNILFDNEGDYHLARALAYHYSKRNGFKIKCKRTCCNLLIIERIK